MARIEHFAVFAENLDALRTFYEKAMGLRVVLDNSKAPIAGYFLADDRGTMLEIIARSEGIPVVSTRFACHTAFWVDDYDSAREALERGGAHFETDTAVESPTIRTAFFDDPQGNRCQIVWRATPLI